MSLDIIIDTLWWYKTWQTHAKQKLLRKHKGACKSSWSRPGSLKSFTLTIPWNLAKFVRIFPGIIVRRHHTVRKQMRLLEEQCAESRKGHLQYCCNSGLKATGSPTQLLLLLLLQCILSRASNQLVLTVLDLLGQELCTMVIQTLFCLPLGGRSWRSKPRLNRQRFWAQFARVLQFFSANSSARVKAACTFTSWTKTNSFALTPCFRVSILVAIASLAAAGATASMLFCRLSCDVAASQ